MSKPKAQGTAWETAFVNACQDVGLAADRLPEGGLRDAGDVWINATPSKTIMANDIVVLAWKRLVDVGQNKRVADGTPAVIIMSTDDFYRLALRVSAYDFSFVVECKATQTLNVTRTLANAKRKLANWKER